MFRSILLVAFLAILPVLGFNRYDVFSEKAKIRQVCEEQVESWRMQDYDGESRAWAHTPYAMKMLTNGTRTIGWPAIEKQYRASFPEDRQNQEPDFFVELSDFYIHIEGKTAWCVFDQHQIFPSPTGNDNEIYETLEVRCMEKINNRWQIVFQLTGPYEQVAEQIDLSQMKR